jgi:hypothetical protein
MEEILQRPYVREFQMVCVDPSPSRPPLPPWLKSVPTIELSGSADRLVGPGPVNNWLFERKLSGGGGAETKKTAADAMQERNAPLMPPAYVPDMAPRPDASSRTPAPIRGAAASLPPAISSSTPANSSMAPPSLDGSGPSAYHMSEMSGWSDNYSFLGSDAPISRNFHMLDLGGAPGGAAPAAAAVKRSAKEEALLREFESFTAARDRDVPGPVRRQ